MNGKTTFGPILTAMVTPFTADGSVDWTGAGDLLEHLAENGSDGVVIAGTTGEAPTLTDDEQVDLVRLAVERAGERLSVIAGAGSNDTHHAVELTKRVADAGAVGVLSVTPYYNRPNELGIHAHFSAVAAASDLPVILYNIPARTGTDMPDSLIAEIGERNPTVVGVKQARSGTPLPIPGLDVYAGNDDSFAAALDNGAAGGILVASHLVGPLMARMAAQPDQRNEIDSQLRDLYSALACTTNPIPIKSALNQLGLPAGPLRLPLVDATTEEASRIAEALVAVGLTGGAGG